MFCFIDKISNTGKTTLNFDYTKYLQNSKIIIWQVNHLANYQKWTLGEGASKCKRGFMRLRRDTPLHSCETHFWSQSRLLDVWGVSAYICSQTENQRDWLWAWVFMCTRKGTFSIRFAYIFYMSTINDAVFSPLRIGAEFISGPSKSTYNAAYIISGSGLSDLRLFLDDFYCIIHGKYFFFSEINAFCMQNDQFILN